MSRLLCPLPRIAPEGIARLLTQLKALPLERIAEQPTDDLRRTVRRILHQKRTIAGIFPDLTEEHMARLQTVYDRLSPSNAVRCHAWLFDNRPDLLTVTGHDWEAESGRTSLCGRSLKGGHPKPSRMVSVSADSTDVGSRLGFRKQAASRNGRSPSGMLHGPRRLRRSFPERPASSVILRPITARMRDGKTIAVISMSSEGD